MGSTFNVHCAGLLAVGDAFYVETAQMGTEIGSFLRPVRAHAQLRHRRLGWT